MQIESIPFSNTNSFSKLFLDYVGNEASLKPFVDRFPSVETVLQVSDAIAKQSIDRDSLVKALRKQYQNAGINDEATDSLIGSLADKNTYTVTTGHQLQLAGGPLFFTYKILTIIRLAEELNKKGGKKFIPVFWLASEDHDIEEISNLFLFDKELNWEMSISGSPTSGSLDPHSLKNFISELFELTKGSVNEEKFKTLIEETYLHVAAKDLSIATRRFVHKLFQGFPLLIIDGNDKTLKRSFIPVLLKEAESSFSHKAVTATTERLEAAGYKGQAHSREFNLFYLNGNDRERIEKQGRSFRTVTGKKEWDLQSISEEIENNPERFSPNVILRPLYQQTILPNVAYVGGPAELAYWIQLADVFKESEVIYPVVVPRNSAMIIDSKQLDKFRKTGFDLPDLFRDEATLIAEFVKKNSENLDLENEKKRLTELYSSIITKAEKTDPTLKATAEAELKKTFNSLDAFHHKLMRAEKQKHENVLNQIRKIRQKLFPGDGLQERQETIIPFYLKKGDALMKELYDVMQPVPKEFVIVIQD
jgi:bacillithiol synthase